MKIQKYMNSNNDDDNLNDNSKYILNGRRKIDNNAVLDDLKKLDNNLIRLKRQDNEVSM